MRSIRSPLCVVIFLFGWLFFGWWCSRLENEIEKVWWKMFDAARWLRNKCKEIHSFNSTITFNQIIDEYSNDMRATTCDRGFRNNPVLDHVVS